MAMRFEHEFTVPVPVEQAWSVLLDVERVAPCLPGASLDGVAGEVFSGRMKVKVGPITVTYRGEASFTSVDKDARTLSLKASGKEARGTGTAGATVTATLAGEGPRTRVRVETSFTVTGRPAQFGRGVMAEVGAKLIDRFAENLAALLREAPGEAGAETVAADVAAAEVTAVAEVPEGEVPEGEVAAPAPEGEDAALGTTPFNAPAVPSSAEPSGFGPEEVPVPAAEGREPGQRHLSAVPDAHGGARSGEAASWEAHPAGTIRTSRTAEEEALDLLRIAGVPMLKRVAPLVAALTAVVVLAWLVRRALKGR
ncbi:carbon monoxide dehydrogenase subunit G [Sphaerisporangium krabiense]|uniref:Carbon monoxide dehydrogenase subunit G n=1 Tax=Sphaerisporangium krabiense TaxID=763782 RepID=A0A7W8YZV0_9ACTN|nr:SRPBCC family protein [Sphaerisporangium krabiense]MBB5624856.1 carbon monoxide dehydrogenase subunit G [Sphaerisporangium krabiense]GII66442.1 carbon monoxide dehydrogenase subunit G [Sphaerisporangium krabiense]